MQKTFYTAGFLFCCSSINVVTEGLPITTILDTFGCHCCAKPFGHTTDFDAKNLSNFDLSQTCWLNSFYIKIRILLEDLSTTNSGKLTLWHYWQNSNFVVVHHTTFNTKTVQSASLNCFFCAQISVVCKFLGKTVTPGIISRKHYVTAEAKTVVHDFIMIYPWSLNYIFQEIPAGSNVKNLESVEMHQLEWITDFCLGNRERRYNNIQD